MDEPRRWEYRVETFGSALRGPSDEDLELALNRLGLEGREAVSTPAREGSYRLIAVRPALILAAGCPG